MSYYRREVIQAETTITTAGGNVDISIGRGEPAAMGGEFTSIAVLYVKTATLVNTPSLDFSIWNVIMGTNVLVGSISGVTTATVTALIVGGGTTVGNYTSSKRPLHPPFMIRQTCSGATASVDTTVELHWLAAKMHN